MALDGIFGALLLGTWAASILFGLVVGEAYKYFTTFPNDAWKYKGFVIVALAVCCAALLGDYANTYLPTVTYWGDVEAIQKVYWPLPLYSISNTLLAIIVDCFLIHRLHTLSKNIWLTILLYALIALAVGVPRVSISFVEWLTPSIQLTGYLMGFIPLVIGSGTLADRNKAKVGAIINFITMVVVDMLTAAGLIWKLRTMRSSFANTNSFLNRVMVGAVQTGVTTSVCSILLLITFLNNPQSNVATFFIFQFAPLYTLTLLYNFNLRPKPGVSGTSKTSGSRNGNHNIVMEGIHVHRTAIVTMDSSTEANRRRMEEGDNSMSKQDPEVESMSARKVTVTTLNN
ncbi:hypothetical protein B0H19DRAFT_1264893 [Mycena capillaripes]|nr:hypothetical protein B0H19DRAFT_1264893 [Mycena capillaripes]